MIEIKASQMEGKAWDPYPTEEEAEQYDEISTVQQQWALSILEQCDFLH